MKKVVVVTSDYKEITFDAKPSWDLTVHNTGEGLLLINAVKNKPKTIAVFKNWQYWLEILDEENQ